jgi:hypothetical protein
VTTEISAWLDFKLRGDWESMMHAYESKNATSNAARKRILDAHGVCWSALNTIPGFMPIKGAPLDLMHNLLGASIYCLHKFTVSVCLRNCW